VNGYDIFIDFLSILYPFIKMRMQNTIVSIIFASVLLLLLVGATSIVSNQAFAATYQNNRYGYSIWYPSSWIVNGNVWSSIIILQPKIDSCKCTLLVVGAAVTTAQPRNATLEHSKDMWTSQEVTFEPVKNVTHTTFLGMPAYKIVYASDLPKHEMTKLLAVKNGIEYSIDFDTHDPQLPVIQKMIDSFRIITSPSSAAG
jgi:PsbP-like protein